MNQAWLNPGALTMSTGYYVSFSNSLFCFPIWWQALPVRWQMRPPTTPGLHSPSLAILSRKAVFPRSSKKSPGNGQLAWAGVNSYPWTLRPGSWVCPWSCGIGSIPNNPHGQRDSQKRIRMLFQKEEEWLLDGQSQVCYEKDMGKRERKFTEEIHGKCDEAAWNYPSLMFIKHLLIHHLDPCTVFEIGNITLFYRWENEVTGKLKDFPSAKVRQGTRTPDPVSGGLSPNYADTTSYWETLQCT